MNDLQPIPLPPDPPPGQAVLELLKALLQNGAAGASANGHGERVRPTVETIFQWYESRIPPGRNAMAVKEHGRVRRLFCAYKSECESVPWAYRPVDTFKPYHLKEFLDRVAGGHANHTRKRWASSIQSAMNEAAQLGLIERNPFLGLRLPQGRQGRDWTAAELQAILREATPGYRRLMIFIRFSGARPGEARKARWEHLDLAGRCLVLREHKTSHIVRVPRVIHLNDICLKLLLWIKRNQRPERPHIFINSRGNPWTIRAVVQQLAELRERLNLPEDLKLHGLRHAFATNALTNGLDIASVGALLGHTNLASTQRYVHVADKRHHLQQSIEKAVERRRPAELCRQAAEWAYARKPELRRANYVELHAYLMESPWAPWLPKRVRTFGQYMTNSRQAKEGGQP
jgi:integrase